MQIKKVRRHKYNVPGKKKNKNMNQTEKAE